MPSSYAIRDDVDWPPRLIRPIRPPALIYLDMNHYINLAKAEIGTAPQGYSELLQSCRKAQADGRAVFPLSSTHFVEVSNIGSYRQRENLAAVMEELSDFNYLLGRPHIMRLEIEAAFDALLGAGRPSGEEISLIGKSALWGFGMRGGLLIKGPDEDPEGAEAEKRLRYRLGGEKFEKMMAHFNREAERALLVGPDDDMENELRGESVYAPEIPYQHQEERAQQEVDQAKRLDENPEWRRGRLRDLLTVHEILIELWEIIVVELSARKMSALEFTDLLGAPRSEEVEERDYSKARNFSDGMPTTRVAVSLKENYHRNREHNWTSNDMHDIDALAVAMPYCDAVFTDAAAWNALKTSRELSVFDTFLPRRPSQLVQWLDKLPSPRTP
jgi:hypothetical protein